MSHLHIAIFSFFGIVFLASCAVPTKVAPMYVPPATGQTAKLVMRGSVNSGENYSVYLFRDSEHCADPRKVGVGNNASHPVSTTITANMLITLELNFDRSNRQHCAIRYSFTPQSGRSYLLSGSALETKCLANLLDATDPDDVKQTPGVLWRNPIGSSCLSLSESRAAPVQDIRIDRSNGEAVLNPGATATDLRGLIPK